MKALASILLGVTAVILTQLILGMITQHLAAYGYDGSLDPILALPIGFVVGEYAMLKLTKGEYLRQAKKPKKVIVFAVMIYLAIVPFSILLDFLISGVDEAYQIFIGTILWLSFPLAPIFLYHSSPRLQAIFRWVSEKLE